MTRGLFVLGFALGLMGCIIPRSPVYDDAPDTPPVVIPIDPETELPLTGLVEVNLDNAGDATVVSFRARVTDPDIDQSLFGLAYVNYVPPPAGERRPQPATPDSPIVPSADDPEVRYHTFAVPLTALPANGCHSVRFSVAQAWVGNPADPVPSESEGFATWIVAVRSGGEPLDVDTCPSINPFSGAP